MHRFDERRVFLTAEYSTKGATRINITDIMKEPYTLRLFNSCTSSHASQFGIFLSTDLVGEPVCLVVKHRPTRERTIISMSPEEGRLLAQIAREILWKEGPAFCSQKLKVHARRIQPWRVHRILSTDRVSHSRSSFSVIH